MHYAVNDCNVVIVVEKGKILEVSENSVVFPELATVDCDRAICSSL